MQREQLTRLFDELLEVPRFRDYCPNGLQVEGRGQVSRVLCGVTASQALIDHACRNGFDTLVVHHGLFWKGDDGRVIGYRQRRLKALLVHDINVFAYHLPLDAHPELGNNAGLARLMGWHVESRVGEQDIVFVGRPGQVESAGQLCRSLASRLGREPLLVGDASRSVHRLAWCTGAAQRELELAVSLGVDCYVSGEISEPTVHLARESGVPYIAAGHHATERYGPLALARWLRDEVGLEAQFVDIDNPV